MATPKTREFAQLKWPEYPRRKGVKKREANTANPQVKKHKSRETKP